MDNKSLKPLEKSIKLLEVILMLIIGGVVILGILAIVNFVQYIKIPINIYGESYKLEKLISLFIRLGEILGLVINYFIVRVFYNGQVCIYNHLGDNKFIIRKVKRN